MGKRRVGRGVSPRSGTRATSARPLQGNPSLCEADRSNVTMTGISGIGLEAAVGLSGNNVIRYSLLPAFFS